MTDIAHNVGKNYKMSAKAQNFLHFICESRRNMLLLQRKTKKKEKCYIRVHTFTAITFTLQAIVKR